ncbi:hypothetical protein Rsub_08049 [Raphidocelis subcapitata]|uniref:Expansin-like EG45 domain-containing protein n=1 Tax=Raphidocelis subcapitata TaxID=307507 RepID=A0A2V0P7W0_9CHLO|nr:hypothetical protein Rsub_08049 [Raphidocelis subcapitata]|eukprot:GBF95926.1 hypothetical protein Rsub_08049 [Raphidocelis subcapitata]
MAALRTRAALALALATAALLAAPARCAPEQVVEGYWRRGRSSWYGNQESSFVTPFVPYRGGGRDAFGVIPWGGCGLTNGDGTVPWPLDQVASYADGNPDYPGSCGRCYEIKCSPGDVLGWNDAPVDYTQNYFPFWEHVKSVPDDQGRGFPGNLGSQNATPTVTVQCWDPNQSVVVKIIDICPCYYEPKGQKPYYQYGCCYKKQQHPKAGQWNFDLSYFAFEKLAHPMAVDCNTKQPIRLEPGYISDVLYDEMPGVGWAWFPSGHLDPNKFMVVAKGEGRNGGAAACADLKGGLPGGMTWACRGCGMAEGYKPFEGIKGVEFWIKNKASPGSTPDLVVQIGNPDTGEWRLGYWAVLGGRARTHAFGRCFSGSAWPFASLGVCAGKYCNDVFLSGLAPAATEGDWQKFEIGAGSLSCAPGVLEGASQIAFNPKSQVSICIDDLRLLR